MGKTDLGKWMITNGGEYSADATYEQLTMVKYGNSTYITLKTVTGITPVDDKINYQLMAQGFDATALSAVQAEDTQGLCGEKGNIVTAQSLVDALADKVINTVMAKIGTAALTGGMTDLSSGLNKLNSDLGSINNKFCSSLDYIDAAYQRVRDINNNSASTKILNDLTYMIQTQKIYSGGFGFANINYSDKPTGASNWGYIEFFKHADNYVTVKYYQDGNAKVYIGQFILGESNWKIVWS